MNDIMEKLNAKFEEFKAVSKLNSKIQEELDKKLYYEFIYNNNRLCGNTLTYAEAQLLLIFDKTATSHKMREYEEMKAYAVAFELIQQWAANKDFVLAESDIKELNKIVLVRPFWKEIILQNGQIARREINIGNYKKYQNFTRLKNEEIVDYVLPADVQDEMATLMQWYCSKVLKNKFQAVVLAAFVHYNIIRIHPFDAANSRVAHLLLNYILLCNDLPIALVKSSQQDEYYIALQQAKDGDMNAFIEYIARLVISNLNLYIKVGRGESIEEAYDIDKEIALWKQQILTEQVNNNCRNNKLVCDIYTNGIKKLFEQYEERTKQLYEMFLTNKICFYVNSNFSENIFDLEEKICDTNFFSITSKKITKIDICLNMNNYKFKEYQFSIFNKIEAEFYPYTYQIIYADKKIIEKKYTDLINDEERIQILNESLKHIFQEIKTKIDMSVTAVD